MFQSIRDTKRKLCGRRPVLWLWLYDDLDDYCAERWEITNVYVRRDWKRVVAKFNFDHAIWLFPHQEAAELSSLKSQLQDIEVPLFAVVKENLGKELDCFKKFFSGKVYLDQKVCFHQNTSFMWIKDKVNYGFFLKIPTEKFLWASTEVDVSLHVPAYWCVEEPLAGLQEGLQGKPKRGRTCPRWGFCHWTWRSGRQLHSIIKYTSNK